MCFKEHTLGNTALKAKRKHWATRPRDTSIYFSVFKRLEMAFGPLQRQELVLPAYLHEQPSHPQR